MSHVHGAVPAAAAAAAAGATPRFCLYFFFPLLSFPFFFIPLLPSQDIVQESLAPLPVSNFPFAPAFFTQVQDGASFQGGLIILLSYL